MNNVLVTGASGFIGSALVSKLNALGIKPKALVRKTSSRSNLEGSDYEPVIGSLSSEKDLEAAVAGVDTVFHLAGVVSATRDKDFFEINTDSTVRLAKACLKKAPKLRRFVYASSIAAAGPSKSLEPVDEYRAPQPVSSYGKSKAMAEAFLQSVKDQLPTTIVRPPLVYGPKDTEFLHVIRSINKGVVPILPGRNQSKEKYYSSVHVDDLCAGLISAATSDVPSGEIFFISGDGAQSYLEMVDTMAKSLQRRALKLNLPLFAVHFVGAVSNWLNPYLKKPLPINKDKINDLMPDYWICSNKKAKELLNYQPQYQFDEGMKQTIGWYRSKDLI